ncbi:MAG: PAS domain S-box protein [bacterium]
MKQRSQSEVGGIYLAGASPMKVRLQRELANSTPPVRLTIVSTRRELLESLETKAYRVAFVATDATDADPAALISAAVECAPDTGVVAAIEHADESVIVECMRAGARDVVTADRVDRIAAVVQAVLDGGARGDTQELAAVQLRQTHKVLNVLVQASPVAIMTVGTDRKVGAVWNKAAERLFGWRAGEVIGRALPFVPDDRRWESDVLLDRLFEGNALNQVELVRESRGGRRLDIALDAAPMRSADGAIVGAVAFMRDVTDEKRHRSWLENSRDDFQRIFDGAPVIQYTMDLAGRFVDVNMMFETITGLSRDEVIGRDYLESGIVPRERADTVEAALETARDGGLVERLEIPIVTRDGHRLLVESSLRRITLYERDLLIGFAIDVTEQRNLQKQLVQSQKLDAVGTLAGGVAHDFNNILTAMKGYLHLARQSVEPGTEVDGYLESIETASQRASRLTGQLLLFSKRLPGDLVPFDLNDSVKEMARMLSRVIGEHISVSLCLSDEPVVIRGDTGQIGQVIMNLVLNARDAMPNGGELTVETRRIRCGDRPCPLGSSEGCRGREAVGLTVADTGLGMDDSTLNRLWEPFFSTKERGKGTGLGLPVARGIVEQHTGVIDVTSEQGSGTRFDICFPAEEENPPQLREVTRTRRLTRTRGARVLLVEDDDAIRRIVSRGLANAGYRVTVARSLQAAEAILRSGHTPDIVFSDVVLPDGSGIELREMLSDSIPVVYTSGYLEGRAELEYVQQHGAAFIPKPFDVDEVFETLNAILTGGIHESFSTGH